MNIHKNARLTPRGRERPVLAILRGRIPKAAGLYMICTLSKHRAEKKGYADAMMLDYRGLVAEATGANIFHDLHETLGRHHYIGDPQVSDAELVEEKVDRIYDTYIGLLLPHIAVHICFFSWLMKGPSMWVPNICAPGVPILCAASTLRRVPSSSLKGAV